jgi:4,5-DOPA dioxygenase extradiol
LTPFDKKIKLTYKTIVNDGGVVIVPALFLAHGSPILALEDNAYTAFLRDWGRKHRPEAVLVFTAHWESGVTTLTFTDGEYETIHDFGGFPEELYRMTYPAKGSTRVARLAEEALRSAGLPVRRDETRGLDHGSWVLLSKLFPEADVPVVQASVNPYLSAEEQYRIGRALRGLGEQNVLVIGSGATVHNLFALRWEQKEPEPWAVAFDDWLIERIGNGRLEDLFRYDELAPHARMAVPRPEHFVPLLIALGSGNGTPQVAYREYEHGSLSYLSFQF